MPIVIIILGRYYIVLPILHYYLIRLLIEQLYTVYLYSGKKLIVFKLAAVPNIGTCISYFII